MPHPCVLGLPNHTNLCEAKICVICKGLTHVIRYLKITQNLHREKIESKNS
jgi:hypothetical protein